jgi:AAA domain
MTIVPAASVTQPTTFATETGRQNSAEATWLATLRKELFNQGLLRQIVEAALHDKRVLALVGPSGSGKSTLASALAKQLPAVVVALDWFILPERARDATVPTGKYDYLTPDTVVRALLAGEVVSLEAWDPRVGKLCVPKVLHPLPLVICEGSFALHVPAVLENASVRVFVDCPAPVRKKRVLHRWDTGEEPSRFSRQGMASRFETRVLTEDDAIRDQMCDCTAHLSTSTLPTLAAGQ